MKITMKIWVSALLLINLISCQGQKPTVITNVSDDFDNDPPIYYAMPKDVDSQDTSPGWKLNGQKLLVTGTVFQNDGKTPASDVLIYYYQTDLQGKYLHKEEVKRSVPPNKLGQTHGYIRGWVKTDEEGRYSIRTIRPGVYPSRTEAAHIHVYIKEPNREESYYIDNFVFDDDKLLTSAKRKKMGNRAGSGVLRLVQKGDLHIGERNIILGLNIPNYPKHIDSNTQSGKDIGEDISSFTPFHAWGADKGTKTCPVCKYGWYHGILYFVGNHPNWDEVRQWLYFFEQESLEREKFLKVYFVYGNEINFDKESRQKELEKIGRELDLKKVALTFVSSFSDKNSEIHLNKIDPEAENTIMLYKRSIVIDKFIDLQPNEGNFEIISNRLDNTINEYFDLPRLKNE